MSEKMKWLEKYAPLGIGVVNQVMSYLVGLVIATVYSMWFIIRYISARNALFEYVRGERKLIEGAVIQDFGILTENLFWGFVIMMIVTILTAVFFYFYHFCSSIFLNIFIHLSIILLIRNLSEYCFAFFENSSNTFSENVIL